MLAQKNLIFIWLGKNCFYHTPRVCDEVLISFLDNAIDKPYISGSYGFDKGDIKADKQGIEYGNELRLRYGRL